jgi:AraC family transcriptional regulator
MLDEFDESASVSCDEPASAPAWKYPLAPRAVHRALDYIHANLADSVRLEDIAGAARMSVFHFSRTFRKATGTGPHRYLLQARVERVKALLMSSDRSLASIADETGFSDQSHMSKVFRKFTGVSPKAFRSNRAPTQCPVQAWFQAMWKDSHVQ